MQRQIEREEEQLERLSEKHQAALGKRDSLREAQDEFSALSEKEVALTEVEKALSEVNTQHTKLEEQKTICANSLNEARESAQENSIEISKIESEIKTLEDFLHSFSKENESPVLNDIKTDPGFEAALSRALGDSLQASLDETGTSYWKVPSQTPLELPKGLKPLSSAARAPKALQLALSQIALVENEREALQYIDQLKQGQSLVSKAGEYWRWDGFCVRDSAPDQQSIVLQQKGRLDLLKSSQPQAQKDLEAAEAELDKHKEHEAKLQEELKTLNAQKESHTQQKINLDKEIASLKIPSERS